MYSVNQLVYTLLREKIRLFEPLFETPIVTECPVGMTEENPNRRTDIE